MRITKDGIVASKIINELDGYSSALFTAGDKIVDSEVIISDAGMMPNLLHALFDWEVSKVPVSTMRLMSNGTLQTPSTSTTDSQGKVSFMSTGEIHSDSFTEEDD